VTSLSFVLSLKRHEETYPQNIPILAVGTELEVAIVNTSSSGSPQPHDAPSELFQADQGQSTAVPAAKMTSNQLKRRAKVVDAVTEIIAEGGTEAVQMHDVARRSGVALATVYNYFSSKDDLLLAALDTWWRRVAQPILVSDGLPEQNVVSAVLDYLRRCQRALWDHPEMSALMLQSVISPEPGTKVEIDRILRSNAKAFSSLVYVVAPEDLWHVGFGLNAAMTGSVIGLLTGRMTLEESLSHVEWVANVLLGEARPSASK
jgi:TetR/AcrR family transcriptional regulator, cholesterol catabolism regulator